MLSWTLKNARERWWGLTGRLFRWPGAGHEVCGPGIRFKCVVGKYQYEELFLSGSFYLLNSVLGNLQTFRGTNNDSQSQIKKSLSACVKNLGIALTDTDGHKNIWIHGQGFMCFRAIIALWRRKWVMPEVVTADTITVPRTVERADRSLRKCVAELGESGRQICRNCRLWSVWEWASVFMEPKDLSKRIVPPVKNYTI